MSSANNRTQNLVLVACGTVKSFMYIMKRKGLKVVLSSVPSRILTSANMPK